MEIVKNELKEHSILNTDDLFKEDFSVENYIITQKPNVTLETFRCELEKLYIKVNGLVITEAENSADQLFAGLESIKELEFRGIADTFKKELQDLKICLEEYKDATQNSNNLCESLIKSKENIECKLYHSLLYEKLEEIYEKINNAHISNLNQFNTLLMELSTFYTCILENENYDLKTQKLLKKFEKEASCCISEYFYTLFMSKNHSFELKITLTLIVESPFKTEFINAFSSTFLTSLINSVPDKIEKSTQFLSLIFSNALEVCTALNSYFIFLSSEIYSKIVDAILLLLIDYIENNCRYVYLSENPDVFYDNYEIFKTFCRKMDINADLLSEKRLKLPSILHKKNTNKIEGQNLIDNDSINENFDLLSPVKILSKIEDIKADNVNKNMPSSLFNFEPTNNGDISVCENTNIENKSHHSMESSSDKFLFFTANKYIIENLSKPLIHLTYSEVYFKFKNKWNILVFLHVRKRIIIFNFEKLYFKLDKKIILNFDDYVLCNVFSLIHNCFDESKKYYMQELTSNYLSLIINMNQISMNKMKLLIIEILENSYKMEFELTYLKILITTFQHVSIYKTLLAYMLKHTVFSKLPTQIKDLFEDVCDEILLICESLKTFIKDSTLSLLNFHLKKNEQLNIEDIITKLSEEEIFVTIKNCDFENTDIFEKITNYKTKNHAANARLKDKK